MESVAVLPSTLIVPVAVVAAFCVFLILERWRQKDLLASVPEAHWSAPFSSLWILAARFRGDELDRVYSAHQRLGPIIRVGPKEISISCYEEGVRVVYGGGMDKPRYYDFYRYFGVNTSFSSLARADHARYRRRMGNIFSKSSLQASTHLDAVIEEIVYNRLPKFLRSQGKTSGLTNSVCILRTCYALSLDFITCFTFGLESGSNLLSNPRAIEEWLVWYERRYPQSAVFEQELPLLSTLLQQLGGRVLPDSFSKAEQWLQYWMMDMCDAAEIVLEREKHGIRPSPGHIPVVYRQLKRAVEADYPDATPEYQKTLIASELFDQISGGREVVGLVLGYALHYIAGAPRAQDSLRAELRDACLPSDYEFDSKDCKRKSSSTLHFDVLSKLPCLSAAIKESFRLRPNSTPLPRITPADRTSRLAGHDIPGGVRVNCFQWLLHRDPKRWHRVHEWLPQRWLGETAFEPASQQVLWPFGSGPRVCLGIHLTDHLMRHTIALMVLRASLEQVPSMTLNKAGTPVSHVDEDLRILVRMFEKENS